MGSEAKTLDIQESRTYINSGTIVRHLTKHKIQDAENADRDLSDVKNEKKKSNQKYVKGDIEYLNRIKRAPIKKL